MSEIRSTTTPTSGSTTPPPPPTTPPTTQLGIITNYDGNPLKYDNIRNPREITLNKYFGLTNIKGPEQNVEISVPEDKADFLRVNFVDNFKIFNKLSSDSDGSESLPLLWNAKFVKQNLIIIYLEAIKEDNKWKTTASDSNRIYIFDEEGKEARIRGIPTETDKEQESKFYTIIIENNTLRLVKDGKKVPFSYVPAGLMTLARLISDLLGDEINYDDAGPADKISPAGREIKSTGDPTVGGKKSRKKQRKGGKKSMKKQRKSMRKMKRSRSKK